MDSEAAVSQAESLDHEGEQGNTVRGTDLYTSLRNSVGVYFLTIAIAP